MPDVKSSTEIVCLNKELLSFDVGDLSIEELEQRLELAIASLPMGLAETDCNPNSCTTNCFSCGNNDCGCNCTSCKGTET
jgi:hypothetical protein